jgi:MoCo/4Fe-4S cofactor protein with predicted Tat translocation signal
MRKDMSRDSGLGSADSTREAPSPKPQALQRDAFWRSLEEKAGDPAFQERLYNEFPSQIEAITDPVQRRTFL